MVVFPANNLLFHFWAEGVNRYIRIGTKLKGLAGHKVLQVLLHNSENLVISICAMSYLTVLTISSVPS